MKIALIGYGKMGKEIEQVIIAEAKHQVVLKIEAQNKSDLTVENLRNVDVAIEFSQPELANDHVKLCYQANVPVVVGTTAWDSTEAIELAKSQSWGLFISPNYSIGIYLFRQLNRRLFELMNPYPEYKLSIEEIHHTQKLDAPSGTALQLASDLINMPNTPYRSWSLNDSNSESVIPIAAVRQPNVPGTHTIKYSNDIDQIEITHTAFGRRGFAIGAVRAAEFLYQKHGFYTMEDLITDLS